MFKTILGDKEFRRVGIIDELGALRASMVDIDARFDTVDTRMDKIEKILIRYGGAVAGALAVLETIKIVWHK